MKRNVTLRFRSHIGEITDETDEPKNFVYKRKEWK